MSCFRCQRLPSFFINLYSSLDGMKHEKQLKCTKLNQYFPPLWVRCPSRPVLFPVCLLCLKRMLIFRFIPLVWVSTRTGLRASVFNKHYLSHNTHCCSTSFHPLSKTTHCSARKAQSALIGQITLL